MPKSITQAGRAGIQQYFYDRKQAIKVARERKRPLVSIYAGQMYFVAAPKPFAFNLEGLMNDQRKVARYLGKPMPRILKV